MFTSFPLFLLSCFLSANGELRYAQVLFRHGDRTPTHTYPTDPHQADDWPEGWGQLTPRGMHQEYELGQFFRRRYVDAGFIHSNYTSDDIHVVSTYKDRAIMSAYCMLAGLYPPTGRQLWNSAIAWQPVPVFFIPKEDDHILELKCPTYDTLLEQFKQTDYAKKLILQHKDLIGLLAKHSGLPPTPDSLLQMIDPIYVEHEHNMTFPAWLMKDEVYKKFLELKDMKAQLRFPTKTMAKIRGGPLLGKIIKNFENVMQYGNILKRIDFYSGHDTNINALLSALDMFNQLHINYASALMLELHHVSTEQWLVEFYYRNDSTRDPYQLQVPGCNISCPLTKLRELASDVIPHDPIKSCYGSRPEPGCPTPTSKQTGHHAVQDLILVDFDNSP